MDGGSFSAADIEQLAAFFAVGRRFTVTNPDYYVISETCVVEAFAFPEVRLTSHKHNLVDAAYMHYTSADELVGEVRERTEQGVIAALASPWVKLRFSGEEATYLFE